jgi:hypothetical protein
MRFPQAAAGDDTGGDLEPNIVNSTRPRQERFASDTPQKGGDVFHLDLKARSTNEDTPSCSLVVIDVVDFKGKVRLLHCGLLRATFDTNDDVFAS